MIIRRLLAVNFALFPLQRGVRFAMRYIFTCVITVAITLALPIGAAGQVAGLARMPDGKPNLQGIWQVLNTASWDIQDHPARLGVPGGQGVVEGNEVAYRPEALGKKGRNFGNRETDRKGTRL